MLSMLKTIVYTMDVEEILNINMIAKQMQKLQKLQVCICIFVINSLP